MHERAVAMSFPTREITHAARREVVYPRGDRIQDAPSPPAKEALSELRTQWSRQAFPKAPSAERSFWKQSPLLFSPWVLLGITGCGQESRSENTSPPDPEPDAGPPPTSKPDAGTPPPVVDAGEEPHLCSLPDNASTRGTASDPHRFRILVMVEEGTRQFALSQGRDIEGAIASLIEGLNLAFNNGQLAATYRFEILDIQYPTLDLEDPSYPPKPARTPEEEEMILLFGPRKAGVNNDSNEGSYAAGVVYIYSEDPFHPALGVQSTLVHETGHHRGAIDLYSIYLDGEEFRNEVYPANIYNGNIPGIMGAPKTDQWDPLSANLIDEVGGDNRKTALCALYWLPRWVPATLRVQVTDASQQPVPNATVEIYRRKQGNSLTPSDLWHTATTDSQGRVNLPDGLAMTFPNAGWVYNAFLVAVKVNGNSYLNWFNLADIAIPYREGVQDLALPAVVSEETRYQVLETDLEVTGISQPPATVSIGDKIPLELTVHNNGPLAVDGEAVAQFYLSNDAVLDKGQDKSVLGFVKALSLTPGQEIVLNYPNGGTVSVPAGNYYLIGEVKTGISGVVDLNTANNALPSANPIQVVEP